MTVHNIIQTQGISKKFGKIQVLDGIDLAVAEGSVLALLGPNGAGKTTIIRILTTLLKPDSGRAIIAGHDILREPEKVRSRIGVVNQGVAVDPLLSGLQNLTMIGHLYRFSEEDTKRRAKSLLEQFELTDAAERPLKAYSGGMRRRLDLAASLLASPPILFLDEPTTGLDPESRNTLWEAIRGLVRGGTTILLTTQNLEEADQLADTVTVIDHGQILTNDTPARLKRKLGGEQLTITLADLADLAKTSTLRERAFSVETHSATLRFALPSGESGLRQAASILQELVELHVGITGYEIKQPTLEEAFLQLIGNQKVPVNPKERN